MKTRIDIANAIKKVAKDRGYDLGDIAQKIGITYISLWSRLKDPKLSTLEQIAGIIDVPVASFFTETHFTEASLRCPTCGGIMRIYLG